MPDFRCVALKTASAATCVAQLCATLDHLHELCLLNCSVLYLCTKCPQCVRNLIHKLTQMCLFRGM